ncbi:MAG: T9SS type A sorting domain-containing protein [Bacteroidales bacterium]|nr:T9SS type A sorting domain-containing protein [Bacteroidales bacterium]
MKKTILSLFALGLSVIATAQNVTIVTLDGKEILKSLATVGRLEMLENGTQYRFLAADGKTVISEGSILKLKELSFIGTVTPVKVVDGNLEADAPTTIYDLSGRKVAQFDGKSYSTSNLKSGVYIVISGQSVQKIIVK